MSAWLRLNLSRRFLPRIRLLEKQPEGLFNEIFYPALRKFSPKPLLKRPVHGNQLIIPGKLKLST